MEKRILLASPTMHGEEMAYINEAFEKNWIAPLGFNCDGFENEMEFFINKGIDEKRYALCLNSCTSAIHLALKLAGLKRGDHVICSDLTFAATVNPVTYEGGIPVLVDSEWDTWNMDPNALEEAFIKYPDSKIVILAHFYGTPSKMDEIIEVIKKHDAILIEDAAEALSAKYKGRECGTFGDYGTLSFNGNKIITTSGGGMLLTKSKALRDRAFYLSTQAREKTPWYQHKEIGYNYRMSNIVAGIGRGQLIHVEEHKALKEKIYNTYKAAFKNLPLTMNPYLEYTEPNFWLSCILLDEDCKVKPEDIYKKLSENNVESRPIWKPMHMQPIYENNEFISTGVGESVFTRGLCLPSDIKMTEEEQNYVIKLVKSCF